MSLPVKLHILGCHAATPKASTHPTAQILDLQNELYLIDCGEGTQVEIRRNRIRFSKIKRIFISHLHGDHFFGLPGLISTFRLLGRKQELHVYGPEGINEAITLLLKLGQSRVDYPLIFHELSSKKSECIHEDDRMRICTIPLKHRIYTNGFLFIEKPAPRKLNMEVVGRMGIDKAYFRKIKRGEDVVLDDGHLVKNSELTIDPPPPRQYAYCSDTSYWPEIIPLIQGVDLLYHETTFLESEAALAAKTGHSTAMEAARIAKEAGVGRLLLGHYSTRYRSLNAFKKEAETIFPNVLLANEGKIFEL